MRMRPFSLSLPFPFFCFWQIYIMWNRRPPSDANAVLDILNDNRVCRDVGNIVNAYREENSIAENLHHALELIYNLNDKFGAPGGQLSLEIDDDDGRRLLRLRRPHAMRWPYTVEVNGITREYPGPGLPDLAKLEAFLKRQHGTIHAPEEIYVRGRIEVPARNFNKNELIAIQKGVFGVDIETHQRDDMWHMTFMLTVKYGGDAVPNVDISSDTVMPNTDHIRYTRHDESDSEELELTEMPGTLASAQIGGTHGRRAVTHRKALHVNTGYKLNRNVIWKHSQTDRVFTRHKTRNGTMRRKYLN
jgi:hypothetical protein